MPERRAPWPDDEEDILGPESYEIVTPLAEQQPVPNRQPAPTRWRLIPAILFAGLGTAILLSGLWMTALVLRVVFMAFYDDALWEYSFNDPTRLRWLILFPLLLLTWGGAWLFSAIAFWRRRWVTAILAVAMGVLSATLWNLVLVPPT